MATLQIDDPIGGGDGMGGGGGTTYPTNQVRKYLSVQWNLNFEPTTCYLAVELGFFVWPWAGGTKWLAPIERVALEGLVPVNQTFQRPLWFGPGISCSVGAAVRVVHRDGSVGPWIYTGTVAITT